MTNEIKITRLVYPQNIRENVGMYLGDVNSFTTPLREIINNSEDEFLNNHADLIFIENNKDYKLIVDNGRGIPIYKDHENEEESILFSTVTDLHAGSKLTESAEVTSGTHGVGSSAVNAVSEHFLVIRKIKSTDEVTLPDYLKIASQGDYVFMSFNRGIKNPESGRYGLVEGCTKFGVDTAAVLSLGSIAGANKISTAVYVVPDPRIFSSSSANIEDLPLRISLSMNKKGSIVINGKSLNPFNFHEDVADGSPLFLDKSIDFDFNMNSKLSIRGTIAYDNEAFGYNNTSLVNLINTSSGGLHERMVSKALGAALVGDNSALTVGDAKTGLVLFINAFSSYRTHFSSQTKERLTSLGISWQDWKAKATASGMSDADSESYEYYKDSYFYETEFVRQLTEYFKIIIRNNKGYFDAVVSRIFAYKASIDKLSSQEFVKSKIAMGSDYKKSAAILSNTKIYEASSTDWDARELYITEGPSASGTMIKVRDQETQSVLPLRGKTKNSAVLALEEFVDNDELLMIINTIGCGLGGMVDVSQSRYGKVIIATDLDVDGQHIANLITSVFLIHAPEFIISGRLYKMESPFYVVGSGDNLEYFYADEKDKVDQSKHVERRKGLGSYSEAETRKFITGVNTRRLIQIVWDENEEDIKQAKRLLYSSSAKRDLMHSIGLYKD